MSRRVQPTITMWTYPGLSCWGHPVGPRDAMPTFVSHNDVGLNFLERGEMRVLMATGSRYTLGPGALAMYWGAVPHKVEWFAPRSMLHWLVMPLGTFLHWAMPPTFTRSLIEGKIFFETDPNEAPLDLALLRRWHVALSSRDTTSRGIVLLELEARLRRSAQSSPAPAHVPRIVPRGPNTQAERMLLLVAEHFREELSVNDVAAAVGLHRSYASGLFRRHVGMGLGDYITECRLSHAKALLATGDARILNVAIDSGFGSVSQFHAIFKRLCRCTPRTYRAQLRADMAHSKLRSS